MNDSAFSFIDVLRILIKKWKPILIGTLLAAAATACISLIIPKSYKANASLIIWESKIGSDGVLSNYFNPRYYYTFEKMIKNKDLAQKAIAKFNLSQKPYEMSVDDFIENITVALQRNSKLIEINFIFPDPKIAADIVNYVAEESINLNDSLNSDDIKISREAISKQLDESKSNLDNSQKKLSDFKAAARIKELETEIEILLYQLADISIRSMDTSIKIGAYPLQKNMSDEKSEMRTLDDKTSETKSLLKMKQQLLAERETELETLMLKYETDQQLFKKIKSRYEESILKISEKSNEIRIIDHAHVPSYPDSPKKKLLVIIASALSFILLCIFFLIKERLAA